ncbi:MAG: CoA pyrophosphatase [Acidobacteria bacterium]|nr:CoA pyrophosphatase [Acidobacteriota bacterium]
MANLRESIRRVLGDYRAQDLPRLQNPLAAVLMPFYEESGRDYLLLTERTYLVETHKGQISFPGGMRDPGDRDLVATALREAQEEIGLDPRRVEVLGRFDEYCSITDLIVRPFAAYMESPFSLTVNPHEVRELIRVPVDFFREAATLRWEDRVHRGKELRVYFYRYGDKEIWGLTARIIKDFLDLIEK